MALAYSRDEPNTSFREDTMRTLATLIAVAFLIAADDKDDAAKKERALLEGSWSMMSGMSEGQALPEDIVKGGKRVSKDGVTTVTIGGQVFMKAKYTVDPGKKPKTIDYDVTEGRAKGKKQLGIYELDGDTVKFCFAAPDKDRPTDFTAKEGSGQTVSVWKRDKK
jgi:uncharacterized protein (TIGR03067 family)